MTGVEILTTEQVVTASNFNWSAAWLAGIIATCLFFVIFCFIEAACDELNSLGAFILSGLFGCMIGGLCLVMVGILTATPSEYATKHKVLISEEVSLTEFYEHYEVIGQDGKLFIVREKNIDSSTEK